MKTKQKQDSVLWFDIDRSNPYPTLIVGTESQEIDIKNVYPDNSIPDIFTGIMLLLRRQVGELNATYLAYKSCVWFFEFKRTKTTISIEILDQFLKPYGKDHRIVTRQSRFKWKGKIELFERAVDNLLAYYPDYKLIEAGAPKSNFQQP